MSTSKSEAQTALIYDGSSAEGFLVFDRQTKRWLRRKCKGLTNWFWDGKPPAIDADNFKEVCTKIYTSLLKTNPSYAIKCWKKESDYSKEKAEAWIAETLEDLTDYLDEYTSRTSPMTGIRPTRRSGRCW